MTETLPAQRSRWRIFCPREGCTLSYIAPSETRASVWRHLNEPCIGCTKPGVDALELEHVPE